VIGFLLAIGFEFLQLLSDSAVDAFDFSFSFPLECSHFVLQLNPELLCALLESLHDVFVEVLKVRNFLGRLLLDFQEFRASLHLFICQFVLQFFDLLAELCDEIFAVDKLFKFAILFAFKV
jgi:hypothetical protein